LSVRIDLAAYAAELEAFSSLADDFVDKGSSLRLTDIHRQLRSGIDLAKSRWTWETRENIVFKPSTTFDWPDRHFPETRFELGFKFVFKRPANVGRKVTVWQIENAATHIKIAKNGCELPFHFDYKNPGQWGPQLHFQVSEELSDLPIPRIPSPIFLPSDCADFLLAELHYVEWRQLQASGDSQRHVSVIRNGQEYRALVYLKNIGSIWGDDRGSTRICMLQDYTASVTSLPDHRNRMPAPW